ncbi:MAG: hypothetical protein IPM82_06590, partial [Saprospiraceae bacterium]|nr:hypothetical protein [Saprospiraceae bacterium]
MSVPLLRPHFPTVNVELAVGRSVVRGRPHSGCRGKRRKSSIGVVDFEVGATCCFCTFDLSRRDVL